MSRKTLSPAELQAADAIAEAVRRTDRSQDEVAAEVGVSQGLIWQWANRRVPVPANRAVALAAAIGLTPRVVSPAYCEIADVVQQQLLAPDEAALLAKYRTADAAGKRSLQAVSDALAQFDPHQNGGKHGHAG
jgi:DNA-binding transcriptional regulator YdaS (Cro superfamily)